MNYPEYLRQEAKGRRHIDPLAAKVMDGAAAEIERMLGLLPGTGLNREQQAQLTDLVSLAMVGVALLKNRHDPAPVEAHPAIAAFWPLAGSEIERRREAGRQEAMRRWNPDLWNDEMMARAAASPDPAA
ncbi:hypothetical protein [Defluviimonas salinarum]|uniref:Phosphoribosyl-ATP pyrophosphohydrolase n=1 Tax=Defluviimonas salinarum TaxID=2992147 RepID=A0ABT3J7D1_9RHOB|nr:hypothetical protein [Defluviimonas salinarum]MCW3783582.1 hypothetical protein [Defluviimonas salinarum]